MANTINDLYTKYTNKVERTLENDRYFQYLFEIVQAGNNTIRQNNRVLHKVVDERWLTVVEEGLTSIFNIVDKPRRFIATTEEVVPVALARKITADSVRHLSQNTQFITTNAKGDIQPTKVLNVTTEESFDLYENRFVYHLIQRLFAFVDKRTDVIFWSTGDETCNTMCMESKIDDAYEEISYKVEMTVKNRQSFAENDNDNMDLFKRIDRVRRMSRTLRASSFCDIMNGCAKVRSPIQRTNLMMKDPDYRNCYKLWQFIESYDEVGYSIEEQDTALEFDEEYQTQMYINLITNYTIFKSLLESDPRKLTEIATKKRRPVKPKFIKKIQEEIVDNCDIPDVEVRKVFIEEVTQAQLDAEAKLAEETANREELENSLMHLQESASDLEWQLDALQQQMDELEQKRVQIEEQKNALEAKLVEEQKAKEELQEAMEKADAEARAAIDNAQTKAKQAIEAAQKNIEQVRAEAHQNIEQTQAEADEAVQTAKSEAQNLKEQLEATKDEARKTVESTQSEAERQVAQAREEAAAQIETAKSESKAQIDLIERQAKERIESIQSETAAQIELIQSQSKEQIESIQSQSNDAIDRTNKEASEHIENIETESAKKIEELQAKLKQALEQAEKDRIDKEKALEKAKANSLSHYIVNALRGRKAAADTSTDIVNAENDEHDKSDQKEDENK
jgi:exonuclease SbcC